MSDPRCEEYRELASAYADEQLAGAELLRLERHLAGCAPCREFEAEVRRLRELLQAAEAFRPLRRPAPGFAAAVMAQLEPQPAAALVPFRAPRRARSWVALAAAAAAAAVFFAWSWQRLLPVEPAAQTASQGAAVSGPAVAAAEEGSMESYLSRHTLLARGSTLLGSAEEVEFAEVGAGAAPGR